MQHARIAKSTTILKGHMYVQFKQRQADERKNLESSMRADLEKKLKDAADDTDRYEHFWLS